MRRVFLCIMFFCPLSSTCVQAQIVFAERAVAAAVADEGAANGAAFGDYNGDGWPDLFVARIGRGLEPLLYANRGDGSFVNESATLGAIGSAMGGLFIDYDQDGDDDLYVVRFNLANALLNNSDGHLAALPAEQLATGNRGATSAAVADFDGDGAFDLFSLHRYFGANQYFPRFYEDGFIESTPSALRSGRESFSTTVFDYDLDGDQDLYVGNFGYADLLYRNDGYGDFSQVAEKVGFVGESFSVAALPADYDNDGDLDLYIVEANESPNRMWRNDGVRGFSTRAVGAEGGSSSAGGVAADFDLDGDVDLLVSNLGAVDVYENRGEGRFADIASTAVPSSMRADYFTAGAAAADYDQDGDIDVFLSGIRGADALLRNDMRSGHWLRVELPSASPGVRVSLQTEFGTQLRELSYSTQLGSVQGDIVHFGLGRAKRAEVLVEWPSGHVRRIANVAADQVLRISPVLDSRDLIIGRVRAPADALAWQPFAPEVEVRNDGASRKLGASLRVQIYRGEESVYDERMSVPALAAGDTAVLRLPIWQPQRSGEHRFVFDIEGGAQGIRSEHWQRSYYLHPFVEVAEELGLDDSGAGWAAAYADYDDDGDLDLYVSNGGSFGAGDNALYRNDGDGFVDATVASGTADAGNGTGVVFADFNRDGYQDLFMSKGGFVPPGQANRLLYNNGDGTFFDISAAAGLDAVEASYAAVVGDYDQDGFLDLYVSQFRGQSNQLYRNVGDGRFTNSRRERRIVSYGRFSGAAAVFSDFDLDGDVDLYASMFGTYDVFYTDVGDSTYATAQVGDEGDAVGMAMGDYDGDGDLDLYIVNQSWRSALWRNDVGARTFVDVASQSGVENLGPGTGCAFGDYDNDGDLDLFVVNGHAADRVYMNRGDGTFVDMAQAFAMADTVRARAVVLGDYDNDGDLDPYIINELKPNRLYRNDANANNWLQVQVRGTESNADAIGAELTLYSAGRVLRREVNGTAGLGHSSRIEQFGLGENSRVDSLVARWPSGLSQRLEDLSINRRIYVREGMRYTAVREEVGTVPEELELAANFPNPFNAETRIRFALSQRSPVELVIFNTLGQRVANIVEDELAPGRYEVVWQGHNAVGRAVASGVYYYRLYAQGQERGRSLVLLR